MKTFKLVSALIIFAIFSFSLQAQDVIQRILDKGELHVGMTGDQPPFTMKINEELYIGFEVDMANSLAENMGVKLVIVQMPFADLLPALEEGKIDIIMSGMAITPQRSTQAMFAGPYTLSGKSILTKHKMLSKSETPSDVNEAHYKVTCLAGSNSEAYVKAHMPKAEIISVDDYDKGVDMVLNNEVDAMVADYPICIISALKYGHLGLETLDQPLTIEPIGLAVPKGDVHFYNLIDNYLQTLELSGTMDMLEQMWFEDSSWLNQLKN